MIEHGINSQELLDEALKITEKLKNNRETHSRKYPAEIEAVLIFSGPGTYEQRLKTSRPEEEWMRWMERDRVRAGVAIARSVAANRKHDSVGIDLGATNISPEDMKTYGPLIVYNGTPEENEAIRRALAKERAKRFIDPGKVLLIDEVRRPDGVVPIAHTAHQVESFYQEIENPNSPLFGVKNVALVSHEPHFARIPFYMQKFYDEFRSRGGQEIKFYPYGVQTRPGVDVIHLEQELSGLVKYAEAGHLSTEPSKLENL